MSDIIRTALKGGGSITIQINRRSNGDFHLGVVEVWSRLTSPKQSVITAAQMDAAEDPDGLLREELKRLTDEAHMYYEAKELLKRTGGK